jgi:hypothetical protein
MNYETAIELAKQRMREIGKTPDEYHIEPVNIVGTATERLAKRIQINAYNDIYFLVNYEKHSGILILSYSGAFNSDDYTENTTEEFTGEIYIFQLPGVANWSLSTPSPIPGAPEILKPLEFIKVSIH